MRNTRFYRRKLSFYRSDRIIKAEKGRKRESIERYISRTFEALPKYIKNVLIEDKEKYISALVNQIMQSGESGEIRPYTALSQVGRTLGGRTTQAVNIFSRFRNEDPSLYAKYNSYMYRRGESASQYFYKNAKFKSYGSLVEVTVELPKNLNGKSYDYLTIKVDFSSDDFEAEMT